MPGYGMTFKFKNPIRASSIPPEQRAHAQLAELGGKKYLRSTMPTKYSLYGRTIKRSSPRRIAVLHQTCGKRIATEIGSAVGSPSRSAIGQRSLCGGRRSGVAAIVAHSSRWASRRRKLWVSFAEAKQNFEMLNLASGFELTLNVSAPGPTSLVVHCNDDAAGAESRGDGSRILAKTPRFKAV